MENKNPNNQPETENPAPAPLPEEESWFADLLQSPELGSEIGPDEQAISSVPMAELSDLELEKIMQEALAEDWPADEPEASEPAAPIAGEYDAYGDFGVFDGSDAEYDGGFDDDREYPQDEEFQDTPLPDEEADESSAPVRKVRPKNKKGYGLFGLPHIASVAVWLLLTVAIGSALGSLLWTCAADILAFGRSDRAITITITEQDDIDSIADKLYNAGLIEYRQLFKIYADITDAREEISAGTFTLNTLYDYHALVNGMNANSSYRELVEVMIPEGYSCAQIFALLEEKGVCTAAELEDYAVNGTINERWFLEGLVRDNKYCLEGYLFPDTYEFYINDSPGRVIGKMLDGFSQSVDQELFETNLELLNQRLSQKMASHGYNQTYINENLMTPHKLITMASIVEKEAVGPIESYTIASVFYNRLCYPSAFPYLNSDATVYYAIGGVKEGGLTAEDYKVDSPYNTYTHQGLTPGPICNPSQASIYAALDPDDSGYYYFVFDKENNCHQFSTTYEEHQQWIDKLGVG